MLESQTDELEAPRKLPRAKCPICGANVIVVTRYHTRLLDYHRDERYGYRKWCAGSEFVIEDEEKT